MDPYLNILPCPITEHVETYLFSSVFVLCDFSAVYKCPVPYRATKRRRRSYGGADTRFLSPQADTSLRCDTTDTGLVHRAVCVFTSKLSLVNLLITPTHRGMAKLSWPGWLVAKTVYPSKDSHLSSTNGTRRGAVTLMGSSSSSSSSSSRAGPGLERSCLHRPRSWACRHAEFSPWLSGWRSASRVRSQVWRIQDVLGAIQRVIQTTPPPTFSKYKVKTKCAFSYVVLARALENASMTRRRYTHQCWVFLAFFAALHALKWNTSSSARCDTLTLNDKYCLEVGATNSVMLAPCLGPGLQC